MSIKQVREFHKAFGLGVRDLPDVGSSEERLLRVRLMLEEVLEFAKAAGVTICTTCGTDNLYIESLDDLGISLAYDRGPDLVAMLHELADVQYVVSGTAVQFGLPLQIAVAEVHAANMRKLGPDGKPVVDARGKVQKPAGWRGADMALVLDAFTPDRAPDMIQYILTDGSKLTLTTGEAPGTIEPDKTPFIHAGLPSPCLDPEKMNGYADQFPGSDEGSQYDRYTYDPMKGKP